MEGYCARCNTSLQALSGETMAGGLCPACGGQISVGSHSRQLGVDGAIGMTFAVGSNIGEPLAVPFDQCRIATGTDEDTTVSSMPKSTDSAVDVVESAAADGPPAPAESPAAALPSFSFDLPPLPGSSVDAPARPAVAPDATPAAGLAEFGGLPPLFGDDGGLSFGAPPTAASMEAPALAGDDVTKTPAHLQLPTFDFSLPPMPGVDGPVSGAPAPAPGDAMPAATGGPAHLQLPNFPDFELPPIPGQEPRDASGTLAAGSPGGEGAVTPPRPPPPPRRRPKPTPTATAALPSIELPELATEQKREVTLLASDEAAELAHVSVRRRPVLPFLIIGAIVAGGVGAWLERDALVSQLASKDARPVVVETAEDKALAFYAKGQDAYAKSQLEEAARSFESAIGLLPKFAKAHRALAIARAKQNRAADAVEHYRLYLDLDPSAGDGEQVRKIISDYEKSKGAASAGAKTSDAAPKKKRGR